MTDETEAKTEAADAPAAPKAVRSPLAKRQPIGTFPPRKVDDVTTVTYTTAHDPDHPTKTMTSTELEKGYHYIDPRTAEEAEVLDGFGLPVAQKVVESREPKRKTAKAGGNA